MSQSLREQLIEKFGAPIVTETRKTQVNPSFNKKGRKRKTFIGAHIEQKATAKKFQHTRKGVNSYTKRRPAAATASSMQRTLSAAQSTPTIKRTVKPAAPLKYYTAQPEVAQNSTRPQPPEIKHSRITHIKPGAKFYFPTHNNEQAFSLLAIEDAGIDTHFDDGSQIEIKIGLDFGTSSVKVVIKEGLHFIAIPFLNADGITAYLLPTILRQRSNGSFTLDPQEKKVSSSLKIDLIEAPQDMKNRLNVTIFLALVLRHIRSWIFSNLSKYDKESIAWECVIGYPSVDIDNHTNTWRTLLYHAWILSEYPGEITLTQAQDVSQIELKESEELIDPDYFQAVPEVCAAVAGFLRNQPTSDDNKGNYTLVDIGSGTVDISSFSLTRSFNDGSLFRAAYSMSVEQLGTTNCHRRRLEWLQQMTKEASASDQFTPTERNILENFSTQIDSEINFALLEPLRDSYQDYFSGLTLATQGKTVDDDFSGKLTSLFFKVRHNCEPYLTRKDIMAMPVIFCGGGARSNFYRNSFLYRHRNIEWASQFRVLQLDKIKDLHDSMTIPIADDDYDRLLVAYGLVCEEPPKVCKASVLEQPPNPLPDIVSKDDV